MNNSYNSVIKKTTHLKIGKRFEQTHQQKRYMDVKHMKKYLTPLDIKEMQTKTAVRCHHVLTRMAEIKKIGHSKYFQGCGAARNSYSAGGNVKWYNHFGSFLKS